MASARICRPRDDAVPPYGAMIDAAAVSRNDEFISLLVLRHDQ
jgi:hypothetical protein